MIDGKHFIDDLPAYALGVLGQAEALEIEAHLSACDSCRAELKAYLDVVNQLSLAVAMDEPGPDVKSRLMKQIVSNKTAADTTRTPTSSSGWRAILSGLFEVKNLPVRLAGLAVLLLLVISNLSLWQQVKELQRPADFYVVELAGTGEFPDAKGILIISEEGSEGTLVVEHLPQLGESQQYQLWLIDDGERTSGGVFSPRESGYGRLWVASPGSLLAYDSFGVTIEPAGGSPGPTGDKILGGDF